MFELNSNLSLLSLLKSQVWEAVVRRCSMKKGVLRNFAKFTGKHLRQSFFLIKLQAPPKFLRTPFFTEHLWWLLLRFRVCNFTKMMFMSQLQTQLFASSYIWLAHIFEASYSTVVTSISKKSSIDQSELEKQVVSHCQTYYMLKKDSLVKGFLETFLNVKTSY